MPPEAVPFVAAGGAAALVAASSWTRGGPAQLVAFAGLLVAAWVGGLAPLGGPLADTVGLAVTALVVVLTRRGVAGRVPAGETAAGLAFEAVFRGPSLAGAEPSPARSALAGAVGSWSPLASVAAWLAALHRPSSVVVPLVLSTLVAVALARREAPESRRPAVDADVAVVLAIGAGALLRAAGVAQLAGAWLATQPDLGVFLLGWVAAWLVGAELAAVFAFHVGEASFLGGGAATAALLGVAAAPTRTALAASVRARRAYALAPAAVVGVWWMLVTGAR